MKSRRRDKPILIYVLQSEKEIIQENAKMQGMNVSDFLRTLGLQKNKLQINPDEFKNISLELNYIGKKINMISQDVENDEKEKYVQLKQEFEQMQSIIFKAINDLYDKFI